MNYQAPLEMELGKLYVFELSSGIERCIAVIGSAGGSIEVEVDGTRGTYATLADAVGGSCVGFRKAKKGDCPEVAR